jgi:DNA-binding MarR family transcriptional regulator
MNVQQPTTVDALLADPRITAIGLLEEATGGLRAKLAGQYAEHDLTSAEFEVLVRLARSPDRELRMSDLAAQTQLTTSGITRVVDRLEADGLVARRACPTDRRGSFAGVTPAGLARLDEVLPGHLDLLEKWFTSLLAPPQLEALLRNLRVIRDAVRPEATAGANARP